MSSDEQIVEAFLRDTIANPNPDPHEELAKLLREREPDQKTMDVAFALYATARTAISAMLRSEKSLRVVDHETKEVMETESIPEQVENVMRAAALVLSLGRNEAKFSPMYYVGELLDLVTIPDDDAADEASGKLHDMVDRHTRAALDNVRKGRNVITRK